MFDDKINISLNILGDDTTGYVYYPDFKDENGRTFDDSLRIAQIMEGHRLIDIDRQRVYLTDHGAKVYNLGD